MASEQDKIRIGTSGYSYPGSPPRGWHGIFYPKTGRRKIDELEFYASFFDTVEINSTFYRPPSPETAAAWAKKTPADFDFAVKVWQKFTHPRVLGDGAGRSEARWAAPVRADVDLFARGIAPLADSGKLGVLLFQYPPGFRRGDENLSRLEWTLGAFESYPKAVEFRHRSWSDRGEETRALLDRRRAAWVWIDEPKFASSVRQDEPRGEILYLRLHGRNYEKWWGHAEAWERYDYFYRPEEIRALGLEVKKAARKHPGAITYVLFNNHARGQAVANALMLKSELPQRTRAAVPRALAEAYPALDEMNPGGFPDTLF